MTNTMDLIGVDGTSSGWIASIGNSRDKCLSSIKFSEDLKKLLSDYPDSIVVIDMPIELNKKNYLNKNYFPRYSLRSINFNHFNQSFKQLIRVKKKNKAEEKIELIKKKKELIKKIISQIKIN